MIRTIVLFGLLGLSTTAWSAAEAELWPFWDASDDTSTQAVDHRPWQLLLDEFLKPHPDGINRLNYPGIAAGDGADRLDGYIRTLTALDPRQLSKAEQLPYWINLYNALTVQVVLGYPDKGSILRMGERLFSIGPWGDTVATIAGEDVSLDDIEHRILRPIWQDHRIHFAVNCASLGCPNLHRQAYTAANTEQLLQEGEQSYLEHPRGVTITGKRRVRLSSIFKWYRADFAESEDALLENYIAAHRQDVASLLAEGDLRVRYDYDWNLNTTEDEQR